RMTLRRLTFTGPNGGSIYIRSSDSSGVVSRMADEVELFRVDGARVFLAVLTSILAADSTMTGDEARVFLDIAAGHLKDVVAIAESRGDRLGINDVPDEDEDDEAPE
ncbi:hypothetical protein AB0M86_47940, partial [Streptomyces sp. NPDC051639]|uniref:hypothetical protein n=1 Tax=Streptomyces sp. NPDC051639 TaxID=3155671 RepID=UPI003427CDEE